MSSTSSGSLPPSGPSTGSGLREPVLEPPSDVADADVLAEVRRSWNADIDRVHYAAVGFGAHHWTAYAGTEPLLFVTYDEVDAPALADLRAAYAGAAALRDAG